MMNKKLLYLILLMFLLFVMSSWQVTAQEVEGYYRGQVISIENIDKNYHLPAIEQKAEVLINSDPYKGEIVSIKSMYMENRQHLNIKLTEGMDVILVAFQEEGTLSFYLQDIGRDRGLLYLFIGFIVLILIVGMLQGLKTLVTLGITAIIIFKVMLPLFLAGYSPIIVTIIAAIFIIFIILVIIGGFNVKSLAAIIGTGSGVLIAGVLAFYVGELSHLTGFNSEEAQMLVTGDFTLDIRGLLFAGIIIGSLGAITDVGMSVASAAAQIKEANPQIGFQKLTLMAFNVGRDIMGTMANTLILAYVGGSIHLLLVLLKYEIDWLRIINMDLIATEVVRGLAGSIGLIIAIPITAIVAGFLMSKKDYR